MPAVYIFSHRYRIQQEGSIALTWSGNQQPGVVQGRLLGKNGVPRGGGGSAIVCILGCVGSLRESSWYRASAEAGSL